MAEILLDARDISLRFGKLEVLRDTSLQIERGEIVTILGPNGSGKSSLLRALVGALPLARGKIKRARGLKLSYVPQKLKLDPNLPMTVARFLNLPRRYAKADVAEALDQAGVGQMANASLADLSGGQLQRVLVARAILSRPDLLLMDEPTQGMDQPGAARFYQQIEALRTQINCAIVMVSHDLHVVMAASDRVICLNGHICCQGAPHVVSQAAEYRALFGTGTGGALALYQHDHDHDHDHDHSTCAEGHDHATRAENSAEIS